MFVWYYFYCPAHFQSFMHHCETPFFSGAGPLRKAERSKDTNCASLQLWVGIYSFWRHGIFLNKWAFFSCWYLHTIIFSVKSFFSKSCFCKPVLSSTERVCLLHFSQNTFLSFSKSSFRPQIKATEETNKAQNFKQLRKIPSLS